MQSSEIKLHRTTQEEFENAIASQESILQSTRNLHYIFQSVFLGISFALIAVGLSILIDLQQLRPHEPFATYVAILFGIAVTAYVLAREGNELLSRYSGLILKRGLIVDVLQHIRLLSYREKVVVLWGKLFDAEPKEDALFQLIKFLERITSESYILTKYGRNTDSDYRWHFALNMYLSHFVDQVKSSPVPIPLRDGATRYLFFLVFCNDLYSDKYLENLPTKWILRDVNDSRKGHYFMLRRIWILNSLLLGLLCAFLLYTLLARI